ncbi:RCC1 and BTB domain-containing protein 1-like [Bolinopsis microptera]|uniref:RCC1 and BTB domain-containing protein 1-like n=1 Tax=Bolinopsis microptera TaxID=2820187 RepID=UPI0030799AC4
MFRSRVYNPPGGDPPPPLHPPTPVPDESPPSAAPGDEILLESLLITATRTGNVAAAANEMNLERWPIFSLLDNDFTGTIKMVCVFGNNGNEAIVVDHNDDVYAIGSNSCCCLGFGYQTSTLSPRKVEALCKKDIKTFAYGSGPHVLCVTGSGELFSWGHNGYSQLGNGTTNQGVSPTPVTSLGNKKIVQIACGSHHSLARTEEGEVFAWGYNSCGQIGSGTTNNQVTPRKVGGVLNGLKITDIACGQTSSMALSSQGDIYAWGYNGNGQLGIGNTTNQPTPRISLLTGQVVVVKIVCGYAHALALTDAGEIYVWGANSYGQLGTSTKCNTLTPVKIAEEYGRFVDIAACHYNHISAAVNHSGKVYMWGQCRNQSIQTPTETKFAHVVDVFACFATPSVTPYPMSVEHSKLGSLNQSIEQAFDDRSTADITFQVNGVSIYAHKAILKIRSQYFQGMFRSPFTESSQDVIEVSQFSYDVYRAFLEFLYTDQVTMEPEDAIHLMDLANAYCEPKLKYLCERIIKQGITTSNAAHLYSAALKYKNEDLQEFCFRFSLNHMTAVVQSEAFIKLDNDLMKSFILKASEQGAFKT